MKKIFVLGAAIRKFCGIDDWDEDWHKDVSEELDELDKDELSGDNWIDVIFDNNRIRLRVLSIGDSSPLLGVGAFASAILVDYNGRECVLKIIDNLDSDKSIKVYEKLLGFKNNLPNGWDRYIPEIYFMKESCKLSVSQNALKSFGMLKNLFEKPSLDIIIMEKLSPISTIPGLSESMLGRKIDNPDIDMIAFDIIKEDFDRIIKNIDEFNSENVDDIVIEYDNSENPLKVTYQKIILNRSIVYDINFAEFLKQHLDSGNHDTDIFENKKSWLKDRIWLKLNFKNIYSEDNKIIGTATLKIKIGDLGEHSSRENLIDFSNVFREMNVPTLWWKYASLRIMKNIQTTLYAIDSLFYFYINKKMNTYILEMIKAKTRLPLNFPKNIGKDEGYINKEFGELFEFLKYLYLKHGIEYEDLHHGNIMLDKDGNYKLSDVGLFNLL
jgi:hypothetical protein